MRIGFDAKRAFYNQSGLGNYSRHTISILSRLASKNEYFLYTPGTRNSVHFEKPSNIHVKTPSGINKILHRSWRTHRMIKNLQSDKIDIFHGLSNELPFPIRKSGVKSVVTIHDLIFMRFPEFYYKHDREIYKSKFSKSCNNADKIIAISQQTKSDIIDFFGIADDKIEVVYQGCDPIFREKISQEQFNKIKSQYHLPQNFILNVGTVEKRKNVLNIIKAIHEHNIDTALVVAGRKTNYYKEVAEYIQRNNMQKQVIFLDKLRFTDLPALYHLSELMIYPSFFEGFGIPIIEALTTGTPVITSKNGCFSEAGGPNSLYVDPTNIEEIAQTIQKLLSDTDLKTSLTVSGKKYVAIFSEENIANNLMNVYHSLANY